MPSFSSGLEQATSAWNYGILIQSCVAWLKRPHSEDLAIKCRLNVWIMIESVGMALEEFASRALFSWECDIFECARNEAQLTIDWDGFPARDSCSSSLKHCFARKKFLMPWLARHQKSFCKSLTIIACP